MNRKELEEALESIYCIDFSDISGGSIEYVNETDAKCVVKAANHYAELLRRIEAGECKVVPCDATEGMRPSNSTHHEEKANNLWVVFKLRYRQAIQAAPDIIADIEKGE